MSITGTNKEQTGRSEYGTVERTKCGTGDEQGHRPSEHPKHFIGEGNLNIGEGERDRES